MRHHLQPLLYVVAAMLSACSFKSPGLVADIGRDIEYEEFHGHDRNGNSWGYKTKNQNESKTGNFVAGAAATAYGLKTVVDGVVAVEQSGDKAATILGRDDGLTKRTGIRSAADVKKAEIAADVAKEEIANEVMIQPIVTP